MGASAGPEELDALVQRVSELPRCLAQRIGAMAVRLRRSWWGCRQCPRASPPLRCLPNPPIPPTHRVGGSEPARLLRAVPCRCARRGTDRLPRVPAGPHPARGRTGGAAVCAARLPALLRRPGARAACLRWLLQLPSLRVVRIAGGGKGSVVSEEELELLLQLAAAHPEAAAGLRHLGIRADRLGRHFQAGERQPNLRAQPAASVAPWTCHLSPSRARPV